MTTKPIKLFGVPWYWFPRVTILASLSVLILGYGRGSNLLLLLYGFLLGFSLKWLCDGYLLDKSSAQFEQMRDLAYELMKERDEAIKQREDE